jgi:hypothetical protein
MGICAVDFFGVAQDDAAVRSTETERVGQGHPDPTLLPTADDQVEIAVGIAIDDWR